MRTSHFQECRAGLKLIEVVVVIVIIVLVIGLLLPAVQTVRDGPHYNRYQCQNNLKQLSLALHNFQDIFPNDKSLVPNPNLPPDQQLSWQVGLLPFIEQDNLYRQFDLNEPWDSDPNADPVRIRIRILICPSWPEDRAARWAESEPKPTTYIGIAGLGTDAATLPADHLRAGVLGYRRLIALSDIPDGQSNTCWVVESVHDVPPWGAGGPATMRGLDENDFPYFGEHGQFGSYHLGEDLRGGNAAFADGSVRFLEGDIDPEVFKALMTANGGEQVDW